jgi:hypothetical protein
MNVLMDDVEVEIARLDKAEGEDEYADAVHQPAQDLTELRQLFLQRSLSLFGLRQRACDLPSRCPYRCP